MGPDLTPLTQSAFLLLSEMVQLVLELKWRENVVFCFVNWSVMDVRKGACFL